MDLSSTIEIEKIASAPIKSGKGFGSQGVDNAKDVTESTPKVEDIEKISNDYAAALKEAYGNKIQFDVGKESGSVSSLHFRVIDRETGEVVHEFPPDRAAELAKNSAGKVGQGLLIDESA